MILQTGMRTDIPAFFSKWFVNRLTEGFVLVRSPYNPQLVTKYIISPHVVDLIGFCSKNPAPMLAHLDLLEPYGQFWFVSITPYGRDIEPHVPDKFTVMKTFHELSRRVGIDCVSWRYDPILITEKYSVERHIADFEVMASELAGFTKVCVISFIDLYAKVLRNFPEASSVALNDQITLAKEFVRIGKKFGIRIQSCAEGNHLAPYGVDISGCMNERAIQQAIHMPLDIPKGKFLRSECTCIGGNDIGAYDSCGHLCRYCYATSSQGAFEQNIKKHDPNSPLLIGSLLPTDKIHTAAQSSWKHLQTGLFD